MRVRIASELVGGYPRWPVVENWKGCIVEECVSLYSIYAHVQVHYLGTNGIYAEVHIRMRILSRGESHGSDGPLLNNTLASRNIIHLRQV